MSTPSCRSPAALADVPERSFYRRVLTWSFAFFNSVRVLAYLPTIWAIYASGDSQQHSWFTWLTWAGANTTMALWLYEQNSRRVTRAVAVNTCNAVICAATVVLILALRS